LPSEHDERELGWEWTLEQAAPLRGEAKPPLIITSGTYNFTKPRTVVDARWKARALAAEQRVRDLEADAADEDNPESPGSAAWLLEAIERYKRRVAELERDLAEVEEDRTDQANACAREYQRAESAEALLAKARIALIESIDVARRTEWDVDPEIQMILAPLKAVLAEITTASKEGA
jgi:hypothetical protein